DRGTRGGIPRREKTSHGAEGGHRCRRIHRARDSARTTWRLAAFRRRRGPCPTAVRSDRTARTERVAIRSAVAHAHAESGVGRNRESTYAGSSCAVGLARGVHVNRETAAMGFYRPLLEKVLFPVLEAAHGRPTVPLLQFLRGSERWSLDALRDLQAGLLRRLIRHAAVHTVYYRKLLDERGMHADDIRDASDLCHLPLLDREAARETLESRTADEPRWVIEHAASALTGAPVVKYNAESRHWRDATRWRGYGWAGYRVGMRALHYSGEPAPSAGWLARGKSALDHALKRDLYV